MPRRRIKPMCAPSHQWCTEVAFGAVSSWRSSLGSRDNPDRPSVVLVVQVGPAAVTDLAEHCGCRQPHVHPSATLVKDCDGLHAPGILRNRESPFSYRIFLCVDVERPGQNTCNYRNCYEHSSLSNSASQRLNSICAGRQPQDDWARERVRENFVREKLR